MKSVRFYVENHVVEARPGETILQAIIRHPLEIDHSCAGFGTCGTCRIFVDQGLDGLESRNDLEQEMALDHGFADNERLACQCEVISDLKIRRPGQG